jgi:hypothetical protein
VAFRDFDVLWWLSVPYLFFMGLVVFFFAPNAEVLGPFVYLLAPLLLLFDVLAFAAVLWLALTYFRFVSGSLLLDARKKAMVVSCVPILCGWLFRILIGS